MDWISGIPDPHRERSIFSHSSSVGDKNHKLASETSILWCVCLSLPPWLWKGHVTMMRYHSCDYITLSWGAQIQSGEPFESRVFLDFPGGPVVKHRPASAGDVGSIPGPRRCRTLWGTKPTQHSHVLQLLKPGDPGACALLQERGHHSEKPGAPTRE